MDAVTFFQLGKEVGARLEIFKRRVSEGKDLQAAKEFCAFLQWSGLLKMLEQNSTTEHESNLPLDGALIRWKTNQLLELVHQRFKDNDRVVSLEVSQLERINHNLELIAGQVAYLRPQNSDCQPLRFVA